MEATYDPTLAADPADAGAASGWRPAPEPAAARDVAPAPPEPAAPSSSPPAAAPEGPRIRPSWAAELLSIEGGARALGRRALVGVGLAALYGLALGAREGGAALLTHALGVPAAIVAVIGLGLPALYILLALFDAPLSVEKAMAAAARGVASAGLALAGLAPLAALYVVTSGSAEGAGVAGALGLGLGGALGLRHLVSTLRAALAQADSATRLLATGAQIGFALFALVLAWRVWGALLPVVGGAS